MHLEAAVASSLGTRVESADALRQAADALRQAADVRFVGRTKTNS